MGVSTDGQICYGIELEEGAEFPWTGSKYSGDLEDWWLFEILGFRHTFEMFTLAGNWIGGEPWPKDKVAEYFAEEWDFRKTHPPLPVKLVNYCSGDYPMYILVVPDTYQIAERGYPETFVPSELQVTEQQTKDLIKFCKDHGIEFDGEPQWYLSSYWG